MDSMKHAKRCSALVAGFALLGVARPSMAFNDREDRKLVCEAVSQTCAAVRNLEPEQCTSKDEAEASACVMRADNFKKRQSLAVQALCEPCGPAFPPLDKDDHGQLF